MGNFSKLVLAICALILLSASPNLVAEEEESLLDRCRSRESWEDCRRRLNREDPESTSGITKVVETAFREASHAVADSYDIEIDRVNLNLAKDNYELSMHNTNSQIIYGQRYWTINVSLEGIATSFKIGAARQLAELEGFPSGWLAKYLLYLRSQKSFNQTRIDPFRASGVVDVESKSLYAPHDVLESARDTGVGDAFILLQYFIAHEYYHVLNDFYCFGDSDCSQKRREYESFADLFAFRIMGEIAKKNDEFAPYLQAPIALWGTYALVQGSASEGSLTHPPFVDRMEAALIAARSWLSKNTENQDQEEVEEYIALAEGIMKSIRTETPADYFAGLDQEASSAALEKLRVFEGG